MMLSRFGPIAKTGVHHHIRTATCSRVCHTQTWKQEPIHTHPVPLETYCDLLKKTLTGYIYPEAGAFPVVQGLTTDAKTVPFDATRRWFGYDWPVVGHTMIGAERLSSLQHILVNLTRDIEGDFLEAGVWRGGACIFARLVMDIVDADRANPRKVWAFDSFSGLPPSRLNEDRAMEWDATPYLEVSLETVRSNFESFGIDTSDSNKVDFIKGLFQDTMALVYHDALDLKSLSVLRMDGDLYESTMNILFNVFHKLNTRGVVIVDDWTLTGDGVFFPAQYAVHQFFEWHNVPMAEIHWVDEYSVYFIKDPIWEQVTIKRDLYEQMLSRLTN